MATERTSRRELAELVTNHGLGNIHGHMLAAVVDGDGVTNHLGKMVDARDQVFTTSFLPASFIAVIRERRRVSTNGPF